MGPSPRRGQEGSSPHGEQREVGPSPRRGQEGSSPHGERREVGTSPRRGQEESSPHQGQRQEGPVSPPLQLQTRQELEDQVRLWQQHLRRQQGVPVQRQVWSRPVSLPALAPHATWASLLMPVKTAVADFFILFFLLAPPRLTHSSRPATAPMSPQPSRRRLRRKSWHLAARRRSPRRKPLRIPREKYSARARETLERVWAGGANRQRDATSTPTRLAPTVTSAAAGTSSAQQDAFALSSAPSAALAARLDPLPQPRSNKVAVTHGKPSAIHLC